MRELGLVPLKGEPEQIGTFQVAYSISGVEGTQSQLHGQQVSFLEQETNRRDIFTQKTC